MTILKDDEIWDEDEVANYIRLRLLQEEGIEVDLKLLYLVLGYEMDYMIEKGIAVPMDTEEE
jgi:hypothetical protein